MPEDFAHAVVQLRRGSGTAGPQRLALLDAIHIHGSITAAAKAIGLSYKGAWDAVQALNNLFERPLVEAQSGGRRGGTATVTSAGHAVLRAYRAIEEDLGSLIERLGSLLANETDPTDFLWRLHMKTSARNAFRGTVIRVIEGPVNAEVVLDIGGGIELVSVITQSSFTDLGLKTGSDVVALIKSSFVILVPGEGMMRTSARNHLTGTIIAHGEGTVSDEITLDLGSGKTLTAIVTRESGAELGFRVGDRAQALIKSSHIILAID